MFAPDSHNYKHLAVSRNDAVATITLSRPDRANALNHDHLAELETAALSFRDEPEVRAIIITGAGKHFSSGATSKTLLLHRHALSTTSPQGPHGSNGQ